MEDRNDAEEVPRFLPINLPSSLLARRSVDSGDRDAHTHRELPVLKRSATTTGSSRSRHRYSDLEGLQPLTPAMPSSSQWISSSPSVSQSSGRRPSLVEVYERSRMHRRPLPSMDVSSHSSISVVGPDSPEDGKNFRRSLEINMKDLVGDAVGNMSISPSSRDIVLAARKGLFIIDLENPLEVPRFLPQGGTWDVADVQWNPHHSRSQYIVSTSSEKMLIWNVERSGSKTSIEHILRSHYRAITDFNWHTSECDLVASTGIDSWIFVWDLRTPKKPAFGLSAFQDAGTQVKWNRQDGNFLASSHGNEVLIWDRRKGSLPMTRIAAHNSKIYGIDWSHHLRNEIVTCSLDRTIKTWDTNDCSTPNSSIHTDYPVWRARNLPFGQGVLSLPQRGETRLEMFARGETPTLVETFDGHSDVVKEFVWRKGGPGEFQLITWSKDRTLRFWPVSTEVMHKVGYSPETHFVKSQLSLDREPTISYRNPPAVKPTLPTLSAPIGHRSILGEVRAGAPPRSANLITQPHSGSSARATQAETHQNPCDSQLTPTLKDANTIAMASPSTRNRGGTMSRGAVAGRSGTGVGQQQWMSLIKVGQKRGGSSGAGSADLENNAPSCLPSRQASLVRGDSDGSRHRSPSRSRGGDERKDGQDNTHSLQEEILAAVNNLPSTSKAKMEKADFKKRTCTVGLYGPWAAGHSVFVRVIFTFPSRYPQLGPEGTPSIDVQLNQNLVKPQARAYIFKRLRVLKEQKRPCLEACLRFLAGEEERQGHGMESDSSDDEDETGMKSAKQSIVAMYSDKNLAEPRTSQGTFGPNGELICFFRAPPRIVRNVMRGLPDVSSPKVTADDQNQPPPSPALDQIQQAQQQQQQQSQLFQSPALVSDALRRLSSAARDRNVVPVDSRKHDNDLNILRTMTNLLTVSRHKVRRDSVTSGVSRNYSLLPTRRSNVFMMDTMNISGPDRIVAVDYIFASTSLIDVCEHNARVAREKGRFDHERIFRTVQSLFRMPEKREDGQPGEVDDSFSSDLVAIEIIMQMYSNLSKNKDVQMLAMLSVIVLQTPHGSNKSRLPPTLIPVASAILAPELQALSRLPPIKTSGSGFNDYFSLARSINNMPSPMSPAWPGLNNTTPSPVGGPPIANAPSVASSNSSRGSWSSLFNTGSVRQFMNGVQDTLKDGLTTPTEMPGNVIDAQFLAGLTKVVEKGHPVKLATAKSGDSGSSGGGGRGGVTPGAKNAGAGTQGSDGGEKKKRTRKISSITSTASAVSRSWGDSVPAHPGHLTRSLSMSFSSAGQKRSSRRLKDVGVLQEKQMVVFEPPIMEETPPPVFSPEVINQFRMHIAVYAELLFRWQLFTKRLELLKAVEKPGIQLENENLKSKRQEEQQYGLDLVRMCARPDCRMLLEPKTHVCPHCGTPSPLPGCTICRLPVKGLSRSCLRCYHVTHISCWTRLDVPICPTGCGCFCSVPSGFDYGNTRPSTRAGFSPPTNTLLLSSFPGMS